MPDRVHLRAGPLALAFDPAAGWVRHVRLGGAEVLRAVYPAVRDRYWNTPPLRVFNLYVAREASHFRLHFDAECRNCPINFAVRGELTGDPDGTLTYRFDGVARSTFLRNRIGLCVLHPAAVCAGMPCEVEHPDGSRKAARFPTGISPRQPFRSVRAIRHEPLPGVTAEVRCEGDVFETEDQRNWTDPSFKTYSTPLAEPFPVALPVGATVRQAVTLRLTGAEPDVEPPVLAPPTVRWGGQRRPRLPALGLGAASHDTPPTAAEVARLRSLRLSHLRTDVTADEVDGLRRARSLAGAVGCGLEVAVHPGAVVPDAAGVRDWLLFGDDPTAARRVLGPAARVWVGTDLYFTHVNRRPPVMDAADGMVFSLNPQVHAFDDESVVETLDGQSAVVEGARRLAGGKPVAVSPVTLRPRFNPHGGPPLPPDPRQATGFAAAWLVGSLRRLAGAGADRVTLFEPTGDRGLMRGDEVFPAYRVLAELAAWPGAAVDLCICSRPLVVEAVRLVGGGRSVTLVANLTDEPQAVPVSDESGRVVETLELEGYEIGRVEGD